jgi:hypothetical protein
MTQLVQALELLLAEATMHYLDVLALVFLRYGLRASAGEERGDEPAGLRNPSLSRLFSLAQTSASTERPRLSERRR